jgi:ABC-type transport system substrate-binding protein
VKGPDGFFRDAASQPLSLEVRTVPNDLNQKGIFAVADYWQRLGVRVDPVITPMQLLTDLAYRATFPTFIVERNPNRLTGGSGLEQFHSREIRTAETNWAGSNRARYSSPELDALIDRYNMTIPVTERNRTLGDIVRHLTNQLLVMGLFYDAEPTMVSKRIKNVSPRGDNFLPPLNGHAWSVD